MIRIWAMDIAVIGNDNYFLNLDYFLLRSPFFAKEDNNYVGQRLFAHFGLADFSCSINRKYALNSIVLYCINVLNCKILTQRHDSCCDMKSSVSKSF